MNLYEMQSTAKIAFQPRITLKNGNSDVITYDAAGHKFYTHIWRDTSPLGVQLPDSYNNIYASYPCPYVDQQ